MSAPRRPRSTRPGHRTLYFVNITDRPDRLVQNAYRAIEAGASALMVDYLTVGISALSMLADDPAIAVPILGHLAFAGAISASPRNGVSSHLVLGKLPRLAGADTVVYPSPYGTLQFSRSEHLRLAQTMTDPFYAIRPTLPTPGGGLHAGMVPRLFEDLGIDYAVGAGGAVTAIRWAPPRVPGRSARPWMLPSAASRSTRPARRTPSSGRRLPCGPRRAFFRNRQRRKERR